MTPGDPSRPHNGPDDGTQNTTQETRTKLEGDAYWWSRVLELPEYPCGQRGSRSIRTSSRVSSGAKRSAPGQRPTSRHPSRL